MKRQAWALCLGLALACGGGGDKPGDNPGPGGNNPDPNANSPFTRLTLDQANSELQPLALAVGPGDRIGVAYFVKASTGPDDYDIRYLQVQGGQVSTPERVATVQLVYGVSVAFDSNGRPAVAYLGGGSDGSVEWLQSDLAVSFRNDNGTWTESIAVRTGNQAVAGNPVSDEGFLVGINPAIVFNGTQAFVAYRDGHNGQFEKQDWDGSDLEVAVGRPGSWTPRIVAAGGNNKAAYGGHIAMVMANGQPALVHDQVSGSPNGSGQNVLFQKRKADGSWTLPLQVQVVRDTQLGASLAWTEAFGYGIAVVDRTTNRLTFVSCDGKTATQCTQEADWTQPAPVYDSGTGGWYPSLAIDPKTNDPSIAFYVCSRASGANEGNCNSRDDELRVTTRVSGRWREVLVDADGGWSPKLAYLSTGKRVIAYRVPGTGVLKLAVEP